MKNLMRKELVLAMHPASMLFLLLSAMLLIPNYPYYVICFYTCLGTFFICLTGRENRDIEFTALLPVRKTDLVRARVFTVMLMQLAQLVIAVPFAVFSSRVSAENLVGMDANTAFFGFALVLYGVFNLVFFRNYYRAPGKVGKAFGWGCGALTLCMVVFEACATPSPLCGTAWTRRTRRSWAKSSPYWPLAPHCTCCCRRWHCGAPCTALPRWTCEPASRFAV